MCSDLDDRYTSTVNLPKSSMVVTLSEESGIYFDRPAIGSGRRTSDAFRYVDPIILTVFMRLSIKPAHLKRYKDIIRLLAKYGSTDFVRAADIEHYITEEGETDGIESSKKPEALAADLERLGPTYVKLGQLLSTRADLLPLSYIQALSRLQDRVEPFSYERVEDIVARELGVRISKAFKEFDPEPVAAASLGQVHHAVLRDGRHVAVKVQRPDIRKQILDDLNALEELAEFLDEHTDVGRKYGFALMLEEFRKTLIRELDYRLEAQNLVTLGRNLRRYELIYVPQPIDDFTTSRVLTMDFVRGRKVTALNPVVRTEIDGEKLAEQLSKAYLDQILVDGFFHADPHPGNVFVTDTHRLALIDLGMVARIESSMQERLLRLLLAVVEGEGMSAAAIARDIGVVREKFDEPRFEREVADMVMRYQYATLEDIEVGRIVVEISRISGDCGIRPASELTMLGKALLHLDEISRLLAPDFNPNKMIKRHADSIMRQRMLKRATPANVFSTMLEMNELIQELPARVNTFFRTLAHNEFEIKVQSFDEIRLLRNLHAIANRLSLSVVLAALILGAALMMRVDTAFTILGYPGIAMILFLGAAACGFILVFSILFENDERGTTRRKR